MLAVALKPICRGASCTISALPKVQRQVIRTEMSRTRIAVIGGSGLAEAFGPDHVESRELDTPFGKPSSAITLHEIDGTEVVFLKRHGEGHVHNPGAVPYRANIYALKAIGIPHIVASGATWSLREEIRPGDIAITSPSRGRAVTCHAAGSSSDSTISE